MNRAITNFKSYKSPKEVALLLYLVRGTTIHTMYEVVLLAKNEATAREIIETKYNLLIGNCKEIKGPFKNGDILMMKLITLKSPQ